MSHFCTLIVCGRLLLFGPVSDFSQSHLLNNLGAKRLRQSVYVFQLFFNLCFYQTWQENTIFRSTWNLTFWRVYERLCMHFLSQTDSIMGEFLLFIYNYFWSHCLPPCCSSRASRSWNQCFNNSQYNSIYSFHFAKICIRLCNPDLCGYLPCRELLKVLEIEATA